MWWGVVGGSAKGEGWCNGIRGSARGGWPAQLPLIVESCLYYFITVLGKRGELHGSNCSELGR